MAATNRPHEIDDAALRWGVSVLLNVCVFVCVCVCVCVCISDVQ